jgi:hypothetical protein
LGYIELPRGAIPEIEVDAIVNAQYVMPASS